MVKHTVSRDPGTLPLSSEKHPYASTTRQTGVLNSSRAIAVTIGIMRAFVRLRSLIESHADLAEKLHHLERRYDHQFKVVFGAIREIMNPAQLAQKRRIGFGSDKEGVTRPYPTDIDA